MKIVILFSLLLILFPSTMIAKDEYPFKTTRQQQQFERITNDMRCMVCQNESLATSTSGFANDVRNEIYRMVLQNKTDKQIINYMTERYGYFVSFEPPFDWETYLLWLGPLLLLIIAVFVWRSVYRNYRSH